MTTEETRPSPWRGVFHHGTFLLAAIVMLLVDVALKAVAISRVGRIPKYSDEVGPGSYIRISLANAYSALGGSLLWVSCVLFLASAYLWVHRDR